MSRKQWGHGFNAGYMTGKREENIINNSIKNLSFHQILSKLQIFNKIFNQEECYVCDKKHELKFKCAECGYEYIHQYRVEVFERHEDEKECLHVIIENGLSVDRSNKSNPSLRRQGIRIKFYCEGCAYDTVVELLQHKGETFINVFPEKPINYEKRINGETLDYSLIWE